MAGLKERNKFEAMFGQRLGKLSGRHRRELLAMAGDPPDLSRVPESWFADVNRETEAELAAILIILFIAAATAHGSSDGAAMPAAVTWAATQAKQRAAAWVQGIRDGLNRVADQIQQARNKAAAIDPNAPPPKFDLREPAATIFSPSRVEGEVITQTTVAVSAGSEFSVQNQGLVDSRDKWRTEQDGKVCPVCKPLDGTTRKVWALKFPGGPPAHPRCRCDIDYQKTALLGKSTTVPD